MMNSTDVKQNQSASRSCATCVYAEMDGSQGECRKLSPRMMGPGNRYGGWPIISSGGWCGKYSAKVAP
jgi:hypothetical protein